MDFIERDELKQMVDRGDDFKLVMAMSEWQFAAMHIPGVPLHRQPGKGGRTARSG